MRTPQAHLPLQRYTSPRYTRPHIHVGLQNAPSAGDRQWHIRQYKQQSGTLIIPDDSSDDSVSGAYRRVVVTRVGSSTPAVAPAARQQPVDTQHSIRLFDSGEC